MRFPRRLPLHHDSGQGLIEYALILGVASIGIMLALLVLRDSTGDVLQASGNRIDASASVPGYGTGVLPGGAAARTEPGEAIDGRRDD
ncbi:MAG: hypothetical protein ABI661_08560 [Gammaproteobacteria bacterium]